MKLFKRVLNAMLMMMAPKWLKRQIMSCEEISHHLISKQQLSKSKLMMLKMHLFICECCGNFSKQISTIDSYSKQLKSIKLTELQKEQISSSKERALKNIQSK